MCSEGEWMMHRSRLVGPLVMFALLGVGAPVHAQEGTLRIIAFGAHPDDNELRLAGTAAKWAATHRGSAGDGEDPGDHDAGAGPP